MWKLFGGLVRGESALWDDLSPISAEIFGPERFAQHAHTLAEAQKITTRRLPVQSVVRRLEDNAAALASIYGDICAHVAKGDIITPAAEWLIDNFHLIEEQIRMARADLPAGFYRQLPKLAEGPHAGHPRVFGIAWAYVAHTDSHFEPQTLEHFVNAYQEAQPLAIGELWAVPIALRLVLIENLRRLSRRMNNARIARLAANRLADRILDPDQEWRDDAFERDGPEVSITFAVQLLQRLRDFDDPRSLKALEWLSARVGEHGMTLDGAVADEHHRQGAANVTVRNIVKSLRFIADANWPAFFENVSIVERMLRRSRLYTEMDFRSRDLYRAAVEDLARGARIEEIELVERLNELAAARDDGEDALGYFLIGKGRPDLERAVGYRPAPIERLRRAVRRAGLTGYIGAQLLILLLCVAAVAWPLAAHGLGLGLVILFALLAVLPMSDIATAVVNLAVTRILDARPLPALALRDGVPRQHRTLVAVPALLTSHNMADELIDRLEVHYLSCGEDELHFALVTDWGDSDREQSPEDDALLRLALERIDELNRRYQTNRFLLLHRRRLWNERQGKWMGWERKRGKLHELNRLLRGASDTSFSVVGGRLPEDVRFVITLDADTRLPRDAARRLIGKLAHPLNRPVIDPQSRRVVDGYAILQPRVTASLPTGHYGSYFQRLFSIVRGIDPYVFAASDLYQDLFGEGSYAGKGIYDLDAFETALAGRFPENAILSHDLIESLFARSALVSDVEVVEDFPERHAVAAARLHRWVRGDWQLLPWIFGRHDAGPIPPLGRGKMLDNLRRSLVPIGQMLSLLAASLLPPAQLAALWTVGMLLAGGLPTLLPTIIEGLRVPPGSGLRLRAHALLAEIKHGLAVAAANLMFLANYAYLMADAIGRTLYRLFVSRRGLLEWTTAAQVQASSEETLAASYGRMWGSVVIGIAVIAIALLRGFEEWFWLLPFAVAWIAAPAAAYWMSFSAEIEDELASSEADRLALRASARRTWRFFEQFVTAQDNMLPPDNFQEDPRGVVAHRTSPTNIGLYLLSAVAAREFGWTGLVETIDRLEATMATLKRMEIYRGHLFNWYDTQNLAPLEPRYVSSVDSGNLAGHLIALANYCDAWRYAPPDSSVGADGLEDVLAILEQEVAGLTRERGKLKRLVKGLQVQAKTLRAAAQKLRDAPELAAVRLVEIAVITGGIASTVSRLAAEAEPGAGNAMLHWAEVLRNTGESHFRDAAASGELLNARKARLERLAAEARQFANGMEFGFLFDPQRGLLSLGYRMAEGMRDENCYDMLASEARLASFFAIAKGDLRARHWFRLARSVTSLPGGAALLSWSGSMFEYLMPSLVMRAPTGGLLDQTTRLIVARQIAYARSRGVPWGISESAFNARDLEFTYQYSNFGVPGLGLKRGLADDLVIAPYATALAAMISPRAANENFAALREVGGRGAYGYYEALDYTPARLRPGEKVAVVKAYFAHHQGMAIVAIFNAVAGGAMREHFHNEPTIRGAELLLQERAPRDVPFTAPTDAPIIPSVSEISPPMPRLFDAFDGMSPATHLLSNGRYSVMLTAAGSGYSMWNGIAVTRWREDPTRDDWGQFFYIREAKAAQWWSAGHMPSRVKAQSYRAAFSEHKAEFTRVDPGWQTTLECLVSSESDVEARRLTLVNAGLTAREIEVTSFTELALHHPAADLAHPAFSKMFVETDYLENDEALIATRRRRSSGDPEIWVGQLMLAEGQGITELEEYETDRGRFIGRCNDVGAPAALTGTHRLSNTVGTVLDPVFALRRRIKVPRGRQARFTLWTLAAASREALLDLIDQHRHTAAFDRVLTLAWTQAQIQFRHLSIDTEEAHLFQELASHVVYASPALRAPAKMLFNDLGAQSLLWPQGISGDRPIVLLRIDAVEDLDVARQLLRAFEYWKYKRLPVDLVILNDRMSSYVQDLQVALEALVRKINMPVAMQVVGQVGEVRVLRADLMSHQGVRALAAAARVVLYARRGRLSTQLARLKSASTPREDVELPAASPQAAAVPAPTQSDLVFYNGLGGFSADGREYVIHPNPKTPTPAPWLNVVANPQLGFQATAEGAGYTWFGNSRDFQITAWSNDAVASPASEAFYVADKKTGRVISPTVLPLRDPSGTYMARHGFGYTRFERRTAELDLDLTQLVPLADSVKISRLRITNRGSAARSYSVTFHAEWTLASARAPVAAYLTTEIDAATGAMFARNRWTPQGPPPVAFLDMAGWQTNFTGDRLEFLGRYGSLAAPAALSRGKLLSSTVGAGLDPCGVMQTEVTIAPGESQEVIALLGAAPDGESARALIVKYRTADIDGLEREVHDFWQETLGAVQVKTPDRAFDFMMNGWLLYQALACRMWARSGFYQASGAYGFRDQLQDSMALLWTRPELTREQILRAASRHFVEGDVQHWWLPATGIGIRTRISDDTAWLAYGTLHYVAATGDRAILDERAPFLEGQHLDANEGEAFFQPVVSQQEATLFEHCARGLDHSLKIGQHGLPLIGTGDWNDGMNRVGEKGQGESVWLGWFLVTILGDFEKLARQRKDERADSWRNRKRELVAALERNGWDGAWYRRAFFDDGSPLGSRENEECRIDQIAQSWAVLSGAAKPERARMAMASVSHELIRDDDGVALLFTPPFDKTPHDPGYIKSYPPGVRENGGQYTHAAIWSVFAFAALGENEKAWRLHALLNPINHALSVGEAARYRVEPYVVAADVYSVPPHVGRGGWTWYTGAAGWLYRAGLEAILGFERQGKRLGVRPCLPPGWDRVEVSVKQGTVRHTIEIRQGDETRARHPAARLLRDGSFVLDLPEAGEAQRVVLEVADAAKQSQMAVAAVK
jgi:cyclic beta-1,2-glucan synthetase